MKLMQKAQFNFVVSYQQFLGFKIIYNIFPRAFQGLFMCRHIIRIVCDGKRSLPTSVAVRLAERMQRRELTEREHKVLPVVVEGLTNKQIATILHITEVTVKLHVANKGRSEALFHHVLFAKQPSL
jgi:DNA-binding CsgD family transcriptional regulator